VEQLMVAFQFQDRVQQIMEQVSLSIGSAVAQLQSSLAAGSVPDAQTWTRLLSAGYTMEDQRSAGSLARPAQGAAPVTSDTTFF
jgi:methyl-accepting chemotaxis protein